MSVFFIVYFIVFVLNCKDEIREEIKRAEKEE